MVKRLGENTWIYNLTIVRHKKTGRVDKYIRIPTKIAEKFDKHVLMTYENGKLIIVPIDLEKLIEDEKLKLIGKSESKNRT